MTQRNEYNKNVLMPGGSSSVIFFRHGRGEIRNLKNAINLKVRSSYFYYFHEESTSASQLFREWPVRPEQ